MQGSGHSFVSGRSRHYVTVGAQSSRRIGGRKSLRTRVLVANRMGATRLGKPLTPIQTSRCPSSSGISRMGETRSLVTHCSSPMRIASFATAACRTAPAESSFPQSARSSTGSSHKYVARACPRPARQRCRWRPHDQNLPPAPRVLVVGQRIVARHHGGHIHSDRDP